MAARGVRLLLKASIGSLILHPLAKLPAHFLAAIDTVVMKVPAVLCVLSATLASAYTPKARLLSKFQQPTADAVLACPTTKGPLSTERKYIGSVVRTCKVSADGVRYPANEVRRLLPPPSASPWQPSAAAAAAAACSCHLSRAAGAGVRRPAAFERQA